MQMCHKCAAHQHSLLVSEGKGRRVHRWARKRKATKATEGSGVDNSEKDREHNEYDKKPLRYYVWL